MVDPSHPAATRAYCLLTYQGRLLTTINWEFMLSYLLVFCHITPKQTFPNALLDDGISQIFDVLCPKIIHRHDIKVGVSSSSVLTSLICGCFTVAFKLPVYALSLDRKFDLYSIGTVELVELVSLLTPIDESIDPFNEALHQGFQTKQ
jgi:hypothetical protein